ncbi:DMT family transporter [Neobacillus notoginsengisoli]|uniref:DMT family transporter n=1 Tax=Neobacillus notoginsengisoli TaxID=1578198 RepID=A0A417YY03_9BACI|nr:DMT family transporter [Neobacillus notoginsengisoli]RHW42535.1 DMT family transporter [Neobacillus notoginsengisoli]
MKPILNPYMALAIGVITVSASAIFVKFSASPSGVIAFYRLFFSVLFMLPLFLAKYTPELRGISKKDWIFTIVAGVLLAFHFILWFESLNYTSVASSTVLVTLQPLFAFIGTYLFFKEKMTFGAIASGIIAIIGSFIISWGDFRISGSALFGDFLALVACAFITGYLLFGQTVRQRVSLITYTFLVYLISTVTLFIYIVAIGDSFIPVQQSDWIHFILLALLPTLLGHSLFNWVVKWISTSMISMAILFEPIGAAILAYILLGESVIWSQIVGGGVVIAGLSLFIINERRLKLKQIAAQH